MIGDDTLLAESEATYYQEAVETLENDVFVDALGTDHFRALDANEESREDWKTFMQRMGANDFLGISIPSEYNGGNENFLKTVLAEQAIGYTGTIVHACQASLTQHIGRTMYEHGSEYIHERYLKPMLAGEFVVSQAFTEPSSGTDIAGLETTAERSGDEWLLNGEKRFIDFAPHADLYFVLARTHGESGDRDGISVLIVDSDSDGIELLHDHADWHGFRGTAASWVAFNDVRVPVENVVGSPGTAWSHITNELNLEHLTISRYCLGAAQKAFEIAASYTKSREVNERPVSRYQSVNHAVAEMATHLDAAYALNTRAARILDRDGMGAGRIEGSMAKWFGTETAHQVVDECMQIMGGIATTTLYPVERIQRDVRAGRYMGGTTRVNKSIVQSGIYKDLHTDSFNPDAVDREIY